MQCVGVGTHATLHAHDVAHHLLCSDEAEMLMNAAPDSFASAFASIVLPGDANGKRDSRCLSAYAVLYSLVEPEQRGVMCKVHGCKAGRELPQQRLPLCFFAATGQLACARRPVQEDALVQPQEGALEEVWSPQR